VIIEAEGTRQARITVSEGEKQAVILQAEGARQSQLLRAEGYALALEKILEAAKKLDEKTMAIQYLEALKHIGESASTKFVFPMEFVNLVKPFTQYAEKANQPKSA
jgi:regulator of protease activity HflC (stomatin/prohibitin superfamily)